MKRVSIDARGRDDICGARGVTSQRGRDKLHVEGVVRKGMANNGWEQRSHQA